MRTVVEPITQEALTVMGLAACGLLAALEMAVRSPNELFGESLERPCWKMIEFDELAKMIREDCIQLLDVRERQEIMDTGLIPSATNIPLSEFEEAFLMEPEVFKEAYAIRKPSMRDLNIVTYCLSGMTCERGRKAIQTLHKLGYIYARTYKGGWTEFSTTKSHVHILPIRSMAVDGDDQCEVEQKQTKNEEEGTKFAEEEEKEDDEGEYEEEEESEEG